MASEYASIDVDQNPPTLKAVADVVLTTRRRLVIEQDGKPVAYLVPAHRIVRRRTAGKKTAADIAVAWSTFGGWKEVDIDTFLADDAASRRFSRVGSACFLLNGRE